MSVRFTDTHLHLDFAQLGDELESVLERARAAGVKRFISVGTNLERSLKCVALAEAHDDIWASVGIHPSDTAELVTDEFKPDESIVIELRELAAHKKVVAFGEIGFDYFHDSNPLSGTQDMAFSVQERLAREAGLPVIIHSRAAEQKSLVQLREHADQALTMDAARREPGVVHCFTGSWEYAEQVLEMGYLIGFTAPVGYPKNEALREVVKQVPLDKLLLETDAPFLPPADKRGQRNEPAYLVETAQVVADVKGIPLAELSEATEANASRLFGLD